MSSDNKSVSFVIFDTNPPPPAPALAYQIAEIWGQIFLLYL